jgi:hypothetical protein
MRGPVAAGWARPEDTKKKSTSQSLLKPRSIVSLSRGRSKPPPLPGPICRQPYVSTRGHTATNKGVTRR